MRQDPQLTQFMDLVAIAGLDGFVEGQGNHTILAPTNSAFSAMGGELNTLKGNANDARRFVLYHTLNGRFGSAELGGKGTVESVLGPNVSIQAGNPIRVNGTASVTQTDIEASNAVIHLIDGVLDADAVPQPPAPVSAENNNSAAAGDSAENPALPEADPDAKPEWYVEPQEPSGATFGTPEENPAFVGGGVVEYWVGVLADSASCKGTTWVVHRQMNGVTEVGADRRTNPYRGDASCGEAHPLLCIDQNMQNAPSTDYALGWAFGTVRATVPIPGSRLQTREAANGICQSTFGNGYRMAEFHDGGLGKGVAEASGWKFWAYGGLEPNQRFWIAVSDQPSNPWNSYNPRTPAKINTWVDQFMWAGQDSAFVGGGHMMPQQGLNAPRAECMGMTWVIHRQFDGLVEVGADRRTNPYKGDHSCDTSLPILCVNVQGHTAPANTNGAAFNNGWSGAEVDLTYPLTGHQINTREKANAACRSHFGGAWRMAEFHDGSLGTAGTDGWKFWAYGGLNSGRRFWVAINDQPANPWNPTQ